MDKHSHNYHRSIMTLDIKTIAAAFLLSSVITVAAIHFNNKAQPQIVTVDLKGILQDFIVGTAASKLEGDELDSHVKEYTDKLERLTKKLALQENFIILPKNAVLAGGMDITEQVRTLLDQGYGNE
jgi:Skp family chaperone for outer membrane proteins